MKKHLLMTVLCAAFALPAAAQETNLDSVVVVVNGEEITMTHVMDIYRRLPPEYSSIENEVLFNGIIDQLVQQRVLAGSIEAPEWTEEYVANERASFLSNLAVSRVRQSSITDENIQAAYAERYSDFEGAEEFNASHILVESEAEAQDLVTKLDGGADFAELAQEFSTGPSGPRGGELGWFSKGMMVPEFENAVLELEPGQVSPPVETQFGWHVVKLNDSRRQPPPALEEVGETIRSELESAAVQARVSELIGSAEVTRTEGIDPNVLTTLQLSQ